MNGWTRFRLLIRPAGSPDVLLLELVANGASLSGGEVFERRDGRTVRVLPVSSDEVEVLD
jgi:hypothetical protein